MGKVQDKLEKLYNKDGKEELLLENVLQEEEDEEDEEEEEEDKEDEPEDVEECNKK
jgi:hypothetical protein